MKSIKHLGVFLLLLYTAALSLAASPLGGSERGSGLLLWQKDGTKIGYAFTEKPVITYFGTDLVITTTHAAVHYPLALLSRLTLELDVLPVGIAAPTVREVRFSITPSGIEIVGEESGTSFRLFNMEGRVCAHGQTDAEGRAFISLTSLTPGIYIINTHSSHFKILK